MHLNDVRDVQLDPNCKQVTIVNGDSGCGLSVIFIDLKVFLDIVNKVDALKKQHIRSGCIISDERSE